MNTSRLLDPTARRAGAAATASGTVADERHSTDAAERIRAARRATGFGADADVPGS